jgi:hypothetical protein
LPRADEGAGVNGVSQSVGSPTGEPADVVEQPVDVVEQRAGVTEQPVDVTVEQPADVTEQPAGVTEQPVDVTVAQPAGVTEQPAGGPSEQAAVTSEPSDTGVEPVADEPGLAAEAEAASVERTYNQETEPSSL